jgi:hypothetical protein
MLLILTLWQLVQPQTLDFLIVPVDLGCGSIGKVRNHSGLLLCGTGSQAED